MFVPLFLYFMESLHQAGASDLKLVLIWSSFTMVEKLQFETGGQQQRGPGRRGGGGGGLDEINE